MKVSIPVHSSYGDAVEGEVVVLEGGFSPRYHLNRKQGTFSVPGHPIDGQKVSGKILVCDFARGGVAAGWALNALKSLNIAPLALVFIRANPVMVQGSIFANITIAEGISEADIQMLKSASKVAIDPKAGQIFAEIADLDAGNRF